MPPTNKRTRQSIRQGAPSHGRYALLTVLCLITVICGAAFVAHPSALLQSRSNSPSDGATADDQSMGTIILQTAPHQCRHITFDNNDSRRDTEGAGPCDDDVVLDAEGKPIPIGTMHRLNAISKSFTHSDD
jgi:hypothetical protein